MEHDKRGRARRRHDLARMMAKAQRVYPDKADAARLANHLAICSCQMCGNPRRYRGSVTIQELRAADAAEVDEEAYVGDSA